MTTADQTQTKTQTAKSEGKTMTTNKKILKYNGLLEINAKLELELRSIQARKEEARKEQSELILPRIKHLQHIGQVVFRKYFPDYHAVSAEKGKDILGAEGWIFDTIQFKEADLDEIILSQVKWVYKNGGLNSQSGWEEEGVIRIPRAYLHMSDRDFAKRIRTKIKRWKRAEKDRDLIIRVDELKKAEAAAKAAVKRLEAIQAEAAKLQETAAEKAAAKQVRLERYEASKAATS